MFQFGGGRPKREELSCRLRVWHTWKKLGKIYFLLFCKLPFKRGFFLDLGLPFIVVGSKFPLMARSKVGVELSNGHVWVPAMDSWRSFAHATIQTRHARSGFTNGPIHTPHTGVM